MDMRCCPQCGAGCGMKVGPWIKLHVICLACGYYAIYDDWQQKKKEKVENKMSKIGGGEKHARMD